MARTGVLLCVGALLCLLAALQPLAASEAGLEASVPGSSASSHGAPAMAASVLSVLRRAASLLPARALPLSPSPSPAGGRKALAEPSARLSADRSRALAEAFAAAAQSDVAADVHADVAPEVDSPVASEERKEADVDTGSDVAGDESIDVAPEASDDVDPEETTDVAPEASNDVDPEVTDDVAPEASNDVDPEVTDDVAPEASNDVDPEVTADVVPESSDDVEESSGSAFLPSETAADVANHEDSSLPSDVDADSDDEYPLSDLDASVAPDFVPFEEDAEVASDAKSDVEVLQDAAASLSLACTGDVGATFSRAAASLAAAMAKAASNAGCLRRISRARSAVDFGRQYAAAKKWAKARNRAAWAKYFLSKCQRTKGSALDQAMAAASTQLESALACLLRVANANALAEMQSGTPLTGMQVDSNPANVAASGNDYAISFRKATYSGARLRSPGTFTSGKFSVRMKCPSGDSTSGLNTAFYLSSNADDSKRNSIIMEFPGQNRNIVLLNTMINGVDGWNMAVNLQYDCSADFHVYTIYWTPQRILWKSDNNVLEIYDKTMWDISPVPAASPALHVYLSVLHTRSVSSVTWPQQLSLKDSTFTAYFQDLVYAAPLSALPNFPTALPNTRMYPIGVDGGLWGLGGVSVGDDSVNISCNDCGPRFHSTRYYPSGEFTGMFKCAAGDTSGLVSSLYLSSKEGYQVDGQPVQDEIDFEWLGKDKRSVQLNYYVNGVGGNEYFLDLGYDCSKDFHRYTIRYGPTKIEWLVDGVLRYTVWKSEVSAYPTKPMFFYASVWKTSGQWAGQWHNQKDTFVVQYKKLRITPLTED